MSKQNSQSRQNSQKSDLDGKVKDSNSIQNLDEGSLPQLNQAVSALSNPPEQANKPMLSKNSSRNSDIKAKKLDQ